MSLKFDGYCNQCAEIHDQTPGLAGRAAAGETAGAICSGCGMTKVDSTGTCLGHNHGVDLRRKREGATLEEVCVGCGVPVSDPIRNLYGVPYCSALCATADLIARRRAGA